MRLTPRLCAAALAAALLAEGCAGRIRPASAPPAPPPPAPTSAFTATAYCKGTRTASGTIPSENTVAADPAVLPIGSRIRLSGLHAPYNRIYVVEDTGPKIRGRHLDLYIQNCREAVRFGRRTASVSILD